MAASQRSGAIEIPARAEAASADRGTRAERRENAIATELHRWRAPVLPDEEIETYAKLFLMKPGHELVPFFLWIDDARRAAAMRR